MKHWSLRASVLIGSFALQLGCSKPTADAEVTEAPEVEALDPSLRESDPYAKENGVEPKRNGSSDSEPAVQDEDLSDLTAAEVSTSEPRLAEDLFSSDTLEAIDVVLNDYPEMKSIGAMAETEGYMAWRREILPEFQWNEEMFSQLQEGVRLVALSHGIENFEDQTQGSVTLDLRFDEATLRRAVGYVVEQDLEGYRGEIMRAVNQSIVDSLTPGAEDPPIVYVPRL